MEYDFLPDYCDLFFRGRKQTLSETSRKVYAYDLKIYFNYLIQNKKEFKDYTSIKELTLEDLSEVVTSQDISEYLNYLEIYNQNGKETKNSTSGIKRKLASLRSFYAYFEKHQMINKNPSIKVENPKAEFNQKLTLNTEQVEKLSDIISSGNRKKGTKAMYYHEHTKYRDYAIYKMLLGTGIRVSELVNLNMMDVDDVEQRIRVRRKGGHISIIYFNNEVYNALIDYIDNERPKLLNMSDEFQNNDLTLPLFVSLKHNRITARRVQQIIKENGGYVVNADEKVTPHSLRRTYGTKVYNETNDLLLTQKALGHESPVTTERYYINYNEERLKKLRNL